MPGLPRKSTAKQFKKLMRKSGKSRTNKSCGGKDPSTKRIATYEQFLSLLESDIIWWENSDLTNSDDDNDSTDYEEHKKDLKLINIDERLTQYSVFILERLVNDNEIILFDKFKHRIGIHNWRFIKGDELIQVLKNEYMIHYNAGRKEGGGVWLQTYWGDMEDKIQNSIN